MSDRLPHVQVSSVAGVAASVPYLAGYQPDDGFVVLIPFIGNRLATPLGLIPNPDPFNDPDGGNDPVYVEERATTVDRALAVIRRERPNATAVIALTWGKFAGHENFMATNIRNNHGFVFTHGHVQDGMYTEIYPLRKAPESLPIPQIATLATIKTPLASRADFMARWDRTPLVIDRETIEYAKAEANDVLNSSTISKILAATRLHLKNITAADTPDDMRLGTIVRVAALIAASERVRDNLADEAIRDKGVREALLVTAKNAPEGIDGDVVAVATLASYANSELSPGQADHFLNQALPTQFGLLMYHALDQDVPPAELHAVVNNLQQMAAETRQAVHGTTAPDHGPTGP